jgi:nucleoside 2-deoxyribosyltransferase
MTVKAYLAGPDVFLPNARAHAQRKVEICRRYGIIGRPPLDEDSESLATIPDAEAWLTIFRKNLLMMEECNIIIANLTPFRGPSADAGTLIEVGWFLGRGRPIFGYSNMATPFTERSRWQVTAVPDACPDVAVENFGLADNLMIPGAVRDGGGHAMVLPLDGRDQPFDTLDGFERCVLTAATAMADNCRPGRAYLVQNFND